MLLECAQKTARSACSPDDLHAASESQVCTPRAADSTNRRNVSQNENKNPRVLLLLVAGPEFIGECPAFESLVLAQEINKLRSSRTPVGRLSTYQRPQWLAKLLFEGLDVSHLINSRASFSDRLHLSTPVTPFHH